MLYQHCNYRGYRHTYTHSRNVISNDQYSAYRMYGCRGYNVRLYEHSGYRCVFEYENVEKIAKTCESDFGVEKNIILLFL